MRDSRTIPGGISMSAISTKNPWLSYGIAFTAGTVFVLTRFAGVSFDTVPVSARWYVFPTFLILLGGVFLFLYIGVCILLYCAARIDITKEDIVVKVGGITLCKLPTTEILSVGFMEQGFSRRMDVYFPQLVLTTEPAESVILRGQKKIAKKRTVRQHLKWRRITPSSRKAAGYIAFERCFPYFLPGRRKYVLMEFTQERLELLMDYLLFADFLL